MTGIRVVSVGDSMTAQVALDAEVIVQPTFTLVRTRETGIRRLVERDGEVLDVPLDNAEYNYAAALFGDQS